MNISANAAEKNLIGKSQVGSENMKFSERSVNEA